MAARWVTLAEAALETGGGASLARLLKDGRIRSRAGLLKVTPLISTTLDLSTAGPPSNTIYVGATPMRLIAGISQLTDGHHHLSAQDAYFLVKKNGLVIDLYMERHGENQLLVSESLSTDFWNCATLVFDRNEAINDNVNAMTRRHAVDISVEIISDDDDTIGQARQRRGRKHKYSNEAVYEKMEKWFRTNPRSGYTTGVAKLIELYTEAALHIQEDSAKRYYYALKAGRSPGFS